MSRQHPDHLIIYQCGSCGNFVNALIWEEFNQNTTKHWYDSQIGHAHHYRGRGISTHLNNFDVIKSTFPDAKRFILVSYDPDDYESLARLHFEKHAYIESNNEEWVRRYIKQFPNAKELFEDTKSDSYVSKFRQFHHDILMLSIPTWLKPIPLDQMDLIITFKEIMFLDPRILVSKLKDFLPNSNSEHLLDVILSYRAINKQYLS